MSTSRKGFGRILPFNFYRFGIAFKVSMTCSGVASVVLDKMSFTICPFSGVYYLITASIYPFVIFFNFLLFRSINSCTASKSVNLISAGTKSSTGFANILLNSSDLTWLPSY